MDIEATIQDYFSSRKPGHAGNPAAISLDHSLLDSGLLDSTEVFEVVTFLEERFGIRVEDDEIVPDHFETVRKLVSFVRSKRGGTGR